MRNPFNYILLIVFLAISIWTKLSVSHDNCISKEEFTCDDRTCIPIGKRCDNVRNCPDKSDEVGCKGFMCKDYVWYKCQDGQCVDKALLCDREFDCVDLSDERNCSNQAVATSCPQHQFLCREEGYCIPSLWVCNGIRECLNGEDETVCEKKPCFDGRRCGSGECVYNSWLCDGVSDCQDGSDEENCGNKTIPELCTADRGLVLCADEKHCILQENVCNGVIDCPDKSDEILCTFDCNERKCPKQRKCIHTTSTARNATWCTCPPGYRLINGMECKDVNECSQYGNCDQLCTNSKGSYSCSCSEGYSLAIDNKTCEIDHGSPSLHFADGFSLKGILTKSEVTFIFKNNLINAVGFTFDGDYMYYTEMIDNNVRITRATYAGTNVDTFITMGIKTPELIAADPITGNVYFTDGALKHIVVCSFDAEYCKILISCINDQPRGFALHYTRGEMFWSEWGRTPRIRRAYMDGSGETDFISFDLVWPCGVAVDSHVSVQRLFWADAQRKVIESAKLDGTDRRIIYKATLMHPYAIAVFESRVYWSDLTTRTLEACDKLNGNNHKIYVKYMRDTIYSVEAYHWHLHENLTNPCEDHPCAEMCLLKFTDFSCACSEGREVDFRPSLCTGTDKGTQLLLIGTINSLWVMEYRILGRPYIEQVPIVAENITAIAFNIVDQSVFLADVITKSIVKVNIMKNFAIDIIFDYIQHHINSLAYDYLGNNLYWSDSSERIIELYNLETKLRKVISTFAPGEIPISIAVVPEKGLLFCAIQKFNNISQIVLMDMDGSNKIKIVKDGLVGPMHLTYDVQLERIFWADYGAGKIESYSINDRGREQYKLLQPLVTGITTLKSDVFWVKDHSNMLFWTNKTNSLDDANVKSYTIEEINNNLQDIHHLISMAPRDYPDHSCQHNNGNCSHLCIPGAAMSSKCSCPLGLKLHTDGRTCYKSDKCAPDEYLCNSSNVCIPNKLRCDNHHHCPSGEDERGCKEYSICPKEYFRCRNGDCVKKSLVCDFNFDCRDKSDENGCESLYNQTCSIKEFKCTNKMCIPGTSVCDNVMDCQGGEDEVNCYKCQPEKFRCNVGTCIEKNWECDGTVDCRDESDEHDKCAYKNCTLPNFLCNNGLCISGDLRCNKIDDCGDFSDEIDCTNKDRSRFCKRNEFACYKTKSLCLSIKVRCNGIYECPDFEDEDNCDTCPFGDFRCSTGECLPIMSMCDGFVDCPKKSDEDIELCSNLYEKKHHQVVVCDDKFRCKNGECIDYSLVCDDKMHCADGSDESEYCDKSCENTTCGQLCERRPTGPICLCREGTQLASDNKTCLPINECLQEPPVCAQKCSDTSGGYKCACFDGFALSVDRTSCKSKGRDPEMIVFVAYDTIFTLTHQRKLNSVFFTKSLSQISDFDVSVSNHYIYYSSEDERLIHRIHTDTKDHSYMNTTGLPQLISIDWITENVYYVNESISSRSISVCNFDKHLCYIIYSIRDYSRITALKVDAINKLLFFATVLMESPTKSKVYKCFLDGSFLEEIHMSDVDYITGITFDYNKRLLYLTEKNDGKIFKITYDGKNQTTILQNVPKATDIALFEDRLFFLISHRVVLICPLYVRYHACTNFTLHEGEISHFAFNVSSIQPLTNNTCKDKKCENLCVPSKGTVRCLCETKNLKNCVNNLVISHSKLPIETDDSGISLAWIFVMILVLSAITGIAVGIHRIGPQRAREYLTDRVQQGVRYFAHAEDAEGGTVQMQNL